MSKVDVWIEKNRVFLKDILPLDTPFNLGIETSSLCNFKCNYCVHSTNAKFFKGNMSWEIFQKTIESVKKFPNKIKKIDLSNIGEPLCNPQFPLYIKYIKEANIAEKVEVITNGTLLTPNKIDEIIDAGIDTIRISLQGSDAEKYKRMCGVNINFEKFVDNLKYLHSNKKSCDIKMKVSAVSSEVETVYRELDEVFGEFSKEIFIDNLVSLFSSVDYNLIDSNIYSKNRVENVEKKHIDVCTRPFYSIIVCANGDITSCCDPINRIVLGNIDDGVFEVWNSEKRRNLLRMMVAKKRLYHPICRSCELPNYIVAEEDFLDPYADEILSKL